MHPLYTGSREVQKIDYLHDIFSLKKCIKTTLYRAMQVAHTVSTQRYYFFLLIPLSGPVCLAPKSKGSQTKRKIKKIKMYYYPPRVIHKNMAHYIVLFIL